MKLLLQLVLCGLFTQAVTAQKMEENNFTYQDGVTYTIKRFNNSKTTEYAGGGDNYVYIAKGGRYKTAWIEFSNETGDEVEIDFEQMFLVDKSNNKYHIHMVFQSGKIATRIVYKQNLKAGKTRLYFAEFWPPFPKDEKIEKMEVNGKLILLKEAE